MNSRGYFELVKSGKAEDVDAVNAFNYRFDRCGDMLVTLPGVCERKAVKSFTDEEKVEYMYTLWGKQEKQMERTRKENGDI